MVFKRTFCLLMLLAVYTIFSSFIFAQNNTQFIQLIEWEQVDYATHYEIILEQKTALNEWVLYETYDVTTNSLELTLSAGDYRYNVTVYNVFGRAEPTSDWYGVKIEQALQPVVADIFPKELDLKAKNTEEENAIITLSPQDVSENATFFLQNMRGSRMLYGEFVGYDANGMMQIEFETETLSTGDYELIIQDPSGLTSENLSTASLLNVERYNPFYTNISAGYSFALFPPFEGTVFDGFTFPATNISARAKITCVPFVSPSLGSVGFELSSYMLYSTFTAENIETSGYLFPITLNVAYHTFLSEKIVLATHIGAGITFLYNFKEFTTSSSMQNAASIAATIGLAGQYFINDHMYTELGFEYIFSYFLNGSNFHTVLPTISVGWKIQ